MNKAPVFSYTLREVVIPSVNKRQKGNPAYTAHKQYLAGLFMEAWDKPSLEGHFKLVLYQQTDKDADNSFKVIQDALELGDVVKDDENIVCPQAYRMRGKGLKRGYSNVHLELYRISKAEFENIQNTISSFFK